MARKTLRSRSVSSSRRPTTSASLPVASTSTSTLSVPAPTLSATEPTSLFQLTDLNNHCLIHVFEFLDVSSLKHMCGIDERFHDIITTHVVPYRTIDFTTRNDQESTRETFSLFGKSMTRIAVHYDYNDDDDDNDDIAASVVAPSKEMTFISFLLFLMKYCEPGRLKMVNITLGYIAYGYNIPAELLTEIGPYFSNVYALHVNLKYRTHRNEFSSFMDAIDTRNVRSLRIENGYIHRGARWLTVDALPNLQKLYLNFAPGNDLNDDLIRFISGKPASLMEFHCANVSGNVIEELSRHLPNIEHVGDVQYSENTSSRNQNVSSSSYRKNWKYFNAFTNLKWVSLKSRTIDFSDSGEVFGYLANRNTIEELHLTFGSSNVSQGTNAVKVTDLQQLTQLNTLHFHNFDEKNSMEFLKKMMANLPALATCTIHGKRTENKMETRLNQLHIIEIIKLARHLNVLKLDCKFTAFSVALYKKLVTCRRSVISGQGQEENPLVIHIDATIAGNILAELGQQYKPSIVMIQSI